MDILSWLFCVLIKKEGRKLSGEEVKLAKGQYVIAIKNLEENLKEGLFQRRPLEFINKEVQKYGEYAQNQESRHEHILSDSALLLDMQANLKSRISEHIKLPNSSREIARAAVWLFMVAKQSYERLVKAEKCEEFPLADKEEKFVLDSIPLGYSNELIRCKQVVPNQLIERFVFQNDQYFLIVEADTKKVLSQGLMNDICVATDASNPKRLNLTLVQGGKAENVVLLFGDEIVPLSIKSYVEECGRRMVSEQLQKIYVYLEMCKEKLKEDPCDNYK
eukprot:TRINITY_DN7289_c0_g1_i12.p2 TRINITY_DN7289_c0_g1~~TRINITY_DN7289_c0_g1_i12.p2  ORF type:complete len:276 (+),score=86.91 TRINITY_DN7289_c0_g1_i12:1903-2730(+)